MEKKYFLLSSAENNKLVKFIQIMFGIACLAVDIFWLIFNLRSLKVDSTLWITIIFLAGFGFYQIWSGSGKATRFIEINSDKIRLKKTIFLSAVDLEAKDILKIEIFPFNLIFRLRTNKKILLRFSTSYIETNEKVKDEIIHFAGSNTIDLEFVEEKM